MAASEWTPPNSKHPPPKPGEPPLHRAARLGDHDVIRRLVAADEDLRAVFDLALDPGGCSRNATPLMVAAGSGDGASEETINLLLALGADLRQIVDNRSPADFACLGLGWNYRPGGDAVRLRRLLAAGSAIHLEGNAGARLIADVAGTGDSSRLRILLDLGANPNPQWDAKEAAEWHSRMFGGLQSKVEQEFAKLGLPAEMMEKVREIQQGTSAPPSAPYSHEIPLFQAAESGSAACVRMLLEADANALQRDNQRCTALSHANSEEVVRTLIAAGLSLDDRDEHDWSPLVSAVMEVPAIARKRVRALIAAGADVNATHDRGYTVFMSAVGTMDRDVEVMQILLDAGADPHAVTELGYNAWHAAIDVNGEANREESVRATFSLLKRLGVDIEARSKSGETPLARAVNEGTAIEVQVLLELGAVPNTRAHGCGPDGCGQAVTPAVFSAIGDPDKLELLLQYGADINVQDANGATPLDYAREQLARVKARTWDYPHDNEEWMHRYQRCVGLIEAASR